MRILPKPTHQEGKTLLITVCATVVLGSALAAFLTLASNQTRFVVRSQIWNSCMSIVEAGIEEALAHCSNDYATNMNGGGWIASGGQYCKTNNVSDGYYEVSISQTLPYEIVCRGYLPGPGGGTYISRTVHVKTLNKGVFSGAMIIRNRIDLRGNNVKTDSYDSSDPAKSTLEKYDPLKAGDKGDVTCVNGIVSSFSVGNADIWGKVITGPTGSIDIGPLGSVGSVIWHRSGNLGIQPGWHQNDFNVDFPDVTPPFKGGTAPASSGIYDMVLGNGAYQVSSFGGKVLVTGEAYLLVTGQIKFTGIDFLEISKGASLKLYCSAPTALFNTIINPNARPKSFMYYGLPSNTSVEIGGNAQITGAVYAPNAKFTLHGGPQLYGSIVAKEAHITGHSQIHYDESLLTELPSRGYIVTAWNEL